jgi:hypothetical protein
MDSSSGFSEGHFDPLIPLRVKSSAGWRHLIFNRPCSVTENDVLILSTCSIRNTFSIVFLPTGIAAITGTCAFGREFFAAALAD